MRYPVVLTPDEAAIMATFPDVPEAGTQGETEAEALTEAVDALLTALDGYFEAGRAIPLPSRVKRGQRSVALPATATAKVLLFNELLAQRVRPTELARRIHVSKSDMTRILDLRHKTRLETLAAAFTALGKSLELSVA